MEEVMDNEKPKPITSKKQLKKITLNPVKNLTMTTSAVQIDGIRGESSDDLHKDRVH
jgi:hypothetical protein